MAAPTPTHPNVARRFACSTVRGWRGVGRPFGGVTDRLLGRVFDMPTEPGARSPDSAEIATTVHLDPLCHPGDSSSTRGSRVALDSRD